MLARGGIEVPTIGAEEVPEGTLVESGGAPTAVFLFDGAVGDGKEEVDDA